MKLRAHAMVAVFGAAALWSGMALAEECDSDADCPTGMECESHSYEMCTDMDCPPPDEGGEDCGGGCETVEESICVPASCSSDADCGDGMICLEVSWGECSAAPCTEGGECPEPVCDEHTESYCAPPYIAPCEADADCGDGFACEEAMMCGCSGSTGSGGSGGTDIPPIPADPEPDPADPGDPGDPDPEPDPDDPTDPVSPDPCECEPSGEMYCEPIEVACVSDADCLEDWICETAPRTPGVCTHDSETGETVCDDPSDPESFCAPPGWGFWGQGVDESGYAESLDMATGGEGSRANEESDADAPHEDDADHSTAGCSAAPVAAGAPALAWMIPLALVALRRLGR